MSKKRRDQLRALLDQAWSPVYGETPRLRLVSLQEQPLSQPEKQLTDLHKSMLFGDPDEMDRAFMAMCRIKWPERYGGRAKLRAIPNNSPLGVSA